MNWFQLLKIAKHMTDTSTRCMYCYTPLVATAVTQSPRHIYPLGQLMKCKCQKSQVWTNSIRDEAALLLFLRGELKDYYQGFCNDKYCPFCWGYIQPLNQGIYGCEAGYYSAHPELKYAPDTQNMAPQCKSNMNFRVYRDQEAGEDASFLIPWYKMHLAQWEGEVGPEDLEVIRKRLRGQGGKNR